MWISRKEYRVLLERIKWLEELHDSTRSIFQDMVEEKELLLNQNKSILEQIEKLKVEYANEVKKNFELANYLSKKYDTDKRNF